MLRIASLGMTTVSLIKDGFLNPSPYLVYFNPKAIVLQGFSQILQFFLPTNRNT